MDSLNCLPGLLRGRFWQVKLNPPDPSRKEATLANLALKAQFNYWVSVTLLLVIQDCLYTPAARVGLRDGCALGDFFSAVADTIQGRMK